MDQINESINSVLDPVFENPAVSAVLKLVLVLYASLAAPSIPPKYAPIFANSYFRIVFLALVVWTYSRDPALSVMLATVYFLIMTYLVHNSVAQVKQTGVVTPEIAVLISGGSGLGIKSEQVMQAESHSMQQSVAGSSSSSSSSSS